jgi:hypothetical protein
VVGLFGRGIVQMTLQSLGVFGFELRLAVGCIGEHLAVEFVLIGSGLLERQGMLGGVEVVELCLGLVAEKARELSKGYGLF